MTVPATFPDLVLRLPDGRRLGYAEYGDPGATPVMFFHGAPGSRRSVFAAMASAAAQRRLRVIAFERPGYGLSDPLPDRTIGDCCADALALADAIGIDRFHVAGFSMGSLFALACAHAMPARVAAVALAGSLAPLDGAGVTVGMAEPAQALYALAATDGTGLRAAMAPLAASAGGLVAAMASLAPPCDQAVIHAHRSEFEADYAEVLRQGIGGIAREFELAAAPWPFALEDIGVRVDLWSGTEDCNTPPAMSRHLASRLPNSRRFELPGEGHFCLYRHWNEFLDRLRATG